MSVSFIVFSTAMSGRAKGKVGRGGARRHSHECASQHPEKHGPRGRRLDASSRCGFPFNSSWTWDLSQTSDKVLYCVKASFK